MLELRPTCEHCSKPLPNESTEAMICSYECTFCQTCVDGILENVCPNCGGGFEKRPSRPQEKLIKNPVSSNIISKEINELDFKLLKSRYKNIKPNLR